MSTFIVNIVLDEQFQYIISVERRDDVPLPIQRSGFVFATWSEANKAAQDYIKNNAEFQVSCMTCDHCGHVGFDVFESENPYALEILDKSNIENFCRDCYNDCAMDI